MPRRRRRRDKRESGSVDWRLPTLVGAIVLGGSTAAVYHAFKAMRKSHVQPRQCPVFPGQWNIDEEQIAHDLTPEAMEIVLFSEQKRQVKAQLVAIIRLLARDENELNSKLLKQVRVQAAQWVQGKSPYRSIKARADAMDQTKRNALKGRISACMMELLSEQMVTISDIRCALKNTWSLYEYYHSWGKSIYDYWMGVRGWFYAADPEAEDVAARAEGVNPFDKKQVKDLISELDSLFAAQWEEAKARNSDS